MTEEKGTNNTIHSQMRKGVLELCTLLIISRDPAYASDILAQLRKADLTVVEGTLYPLLSRLRRQALLTYDWVESENGPPRKYYRLTANGRRALEDMLGSWKSLSRSIQSLISFYEKNQ